VVHAHTLGHKGAAPDEGCEKKLRASLDLFFLHKITGVRISYFSGDFNMVAIAIYDIRVIMNKHQR
jgi:hypothetical protein